MARKIVSKMLVLVVAPFVMVGCVQGPKTTPGEVYQCSYKNTASNHIYYANDPRQFVAVKQAYNMCQNGPANWACYFRFCQQM